MEKVVDMRKDYEPPEVKTEDVFVRSALACARYPFLNPWTNIKTDSGYCGYSDS